jgi:phosphoglycolate phosphatase
MDFYGFTAEQAEEAVKAYRERFTDIGIFENRLYEGIPRMLQACRDRGIVLAIASSKPVVFVRRILAHFAIEQYFSVIVGSNLDGTMERKEEVVQEALRQLQSPVNRDNCAMVGDRRFDVEGARQHRVFALGVSFGYGSPEELAAAGADCIVDSVDELEKVLIGGKE